jgi:hypothetical protein
MLTPPSPPLWLWEETVLHGFSGSPDGGNPQGGLIAYQGALYGTTQYGGTGCNTSYGGCGTVFQVTLSPSRRIRTVRKPLHLSSASPQ